MSVQRIDPEEARALLDSGDGYTYIDVRTEEEYSGGHVPSAVNIPILRRRPDGSGMAPNPDFLAQVEEKFPTDAKLIVGCQRGGRSLKACELLIQSAYTNVVDMRGGYDGELDPAGNLTFPGWARRGLPTSAE